LVPTTAPAWQPAIDMRDSTMSSNCRSDLSGPNMQRPTNESPIPVLIPAGVLLVALSAASPALARSNFDGDWSVVIETRGGACMPSLRYPIAITNGFVTNAGDTPGSVQGRVAPSGAVRVTVQSGGSWANGSGRLINRRQRRLARAGHKWLVRGRMASTAPHLWRSSDAEGCANL
jgi:hypothetical protein